MCITPYLRGIFIHKWLILFGIYGKGYKFAHTNKEINY